MHLYTKAGRLKPGSLSPRVLRKKELSNVSTFTTDGEESNLGTVNLTDPKYGTLWLTIKRTTEHHRKEVLEKEAEQWSENEVPCMAKHLLICMCSNNVPRTTYTGIL